MRKLKLAGIIIFLIIVIFTVYAIYDSKTNEPINKDTYQGDITYEVQYSKTKKTFAIIFSNVSQTQEIEYDNEMYKPNSSKQVTITDIAEGQTLNLKIHEEGEDTPKTLTVKTKYYNEYYGTKQCQPYKEKIKICTERFLDFDPNEDIFETSIENYNRVITN